MKYPADGGCCTLGDTWELYVGKDNCLEYLVSQHGGSAKPSLVIASWAGHKKAGPLLIPMEHRGPPTASPGTSSLLTCQLKLTGSDTWMKTDKRKADLLEQLMSFVTNRTTWQSR